MLPMIVGKPFKKLGFADVKDRHYDEHMILEMKGWKPKRMFVRTKVWDWRIQFYDGGKKLE